MNSKPKLGNTQNTTKQNTTKHLSSVEHCICTAEITNIQPNLDFNPVPLDYELKTNRMCHRSDFETMRHMRNNKLMILLNQPSSFMSDLQIVHYFLPL